VRQTSTGRTTSVRVARDATLTVSDPNAAEWIEVEALFVGIDRTVGAHPAVRSVKRRRGDAILSIANEGSGPKIQLPADIRAVAAGKGAQFEFHADVQALADQAVLRLHAARPEDTRQADGRRSRRRLLVSIARLSGRTPVVSSIATRQAQVSKDRSIRKNGAEADLVGRATAAAAAAVGLDALEAIRVEKGQ